MTRLVFPALLGLGKSNRRTVHRCPMCESDGCRKDTSAPLFDCTDDGCPVEVFRA